MKVVTRWITALAVMMAVLASGVVRAGEATVFAAASLTDVMTELGARHEAASGDGVRFSFASSSTLARQIEAGAPAAIYVSASPQWMDYVEGAGLIVAGSRTPLAGTQLALIAPADSPLPLVDLNDTSITDLLPEDARLAIGDPAHVPAGIYAKEALTTLGDWARLQPRIAAADNVRAALALVERGEAPLGIVYATDAAITDKVRVIGVFPETAHRPIRYPMALIEGHGPAAKSFFDYLASDEAALVLRQYGFRPAE